jgi:hypothetical protein
MMKINVQQLQHQQVTLNMKALRHGLTRWVHQEFGQGFASRSQCDKLGEVIVYGRSAVVEITPPLEVRQFDQMSTRLTPQCIWAIRAQYVCKGQWALMGFDSKKSYLYWLRLGEISLLHHT